MRHSSPLYGPRPTERKSAGSPGIVASRRPASSWTRPSAVYNLIILGTTAHRDVSIVI